MFIMEMFCEHFSGGKSDVAATALEAVLNVAVHFQLIH
jgi:hypothetical protein